MNQDSSAGETVLGVPINRMVLAAMPVVSTLAGALAAWLLVHVHLLGLFHLQHDGLAAAIAQGFVFALTAALAAASHLSWVRGHHIELQALAASETLGSLGPRDGDPSDAKGAHDHPEAPQLGDTEDGLA